MSRKTLTAGAVAAVVLVAMVAIGRPRPIPAPFSAAIPNVVVAINENGRAVELAMADPSDRHVILQAGRGFFYNSWGRFEFNVTLYASDPLSSQSGGGLSGAEMTEAMALGAIVMSQQPGLPAEIVKTLRSPDLTYRSFSYSTLAWRLAVGVLGLIMLLTAWPWIRFVMLIPMLRRRRRLNFFRCPHCNYDLTGGEPPYESCTECGCVWYPEELDRRVVV